MAKITGEFTIDNSELIELRKDIKKYGDTEVLKVLSKFHRELAKEQLSEIRALAKKQRIPKARASATGYTASGTRTEAKINIKTTDRNPSALSLEFGRRFIYVPVRGSGKTRAVEAAQVGKLRYSRPNAKFRYRKWIGSGSVTGGTPPPKRYGLTTKDITA